VRVAPSASAYLLRQLLQATQSKRTRRGALRGQCPGPSSHGTLSASHIDGHGRLCVYDVGTPPSDTEAAHLVDAREYGTGPSSPTDGRRTYGAPPAYRRAPARQDRLSSSTTHSRGTRLKRSAAERSRACPGRWPGRRALLVSERRTIWLTRVRTARGGRCVRSMHERRIRRHARRPSTRSGATYLSSEDTRPVVSRPAQER